MAPSSSGNWVYDIFLSYCGEDVRNTFIGPFLKELDRKLTTSFIVRSHSIAPEFVEAIQDSRIAVVVLSKSYASSSRCLNELLETVKCKEEFGLIVIPFFYGLDGRKQIGEFGRIFSKTCENTTKEKRNLWLKALTKVATYQSATWGNEATMI